MSVNEEADRLRLLIVGSACGPFVAELRNLAEIVLAHANRQYSKSAALPFPQARTSPCVPLVLSARSRRRCLITRRSRSIATVISMGVTTHYEIRHRPQFRGVLRFLTF